MNKKQKALIVFWCTVTALAAWSILVELQVQSDPVRKALGFRGDMSHAIIQAGTAWTAATLISAALFWLFSDSKPR
jgi:anaerobic C4-dicarboxylate transporter